MARNIFFVNISSTAFEYLQQPLSAKDSQLSFIKRVISYFTSTLLLKADGRGRFGDATPLLD
jgi:hypothetical protein